MFKKLLFIIFLGLALQLSAQSTNCNAGLVLRSVEAEVGDIVTVDVTVRNFSDIIGLQYNHSWNPAILDFVEVLYPLGSAINASNFNFSPALTNAGILNFAFLDNTLAGLNAPDNSILYQLSFIYQGGGTSQVSTNGDNIPIEIIDDNSIIIDNYYFMHATVGPHQMQVPPFDAYPYPDGVCIEAQACNDPSLGRITLDVSDQVNSIAWTGVGGFSSTAAEVTGLTSGVYQLSLTHDSGRMSSGDFYVGSSSSDLNLTLAVDADECGGTPDGSIVATVTGGSGNYAYAWSNGAATDIVSNLTAGEYSVTVTDLEGSCSLSGSTTVVDVAPFATWFTTNAVSCDGSTDGSITIYSDASGDALPLTYQWSDGSTTATATGLAAGQYEVTITSANGCSESLLIVLAENSFTFDATVVNNVCGSNSIGSISIPLATEAYAFNWSNGESGTNELTGLSGGVYDVTVTDLSSGCIATETYEVLDGEVLAAINVDCYSEGGLELADLHALVWNNEDGPYTFDWSNGVTNTAQQTSSVTVSESGTYSVTITSAGGCSTVLDNIVVDCLGETTVNLSFSPAISGMQAGETACFEVLADGFSIIAGFQFSLDWDENALDFIEVGAFNLPGLTESDFGVALTPNGKLTVSWVDLTFSPEGISLPDGSPLFEVCYQAINTEAGNATISVSEVPTAIEFIGADFEILPVSHQSAIVYLNGGTGGGTDELVATAGSATIEVGENICIPISIGEVNDLIGFQFTLGWDPSALLYTGVQSLNLPYLEETNFGSLAESQSDGRLRVFWNDLSLIGLNLGAETVAFEVCFLASGSEGEYPLFFDPNVLPTEAVNTSFEYMSTTTFAGTITINENNTNPDAASFLINSVAAAPGEDLCVPVEVADFEDIVGMQFSINWDDELLSFNGVEVVEGLDFLTDASFNAVGDNTLACSWIADNLESRTFAAGTVIFELCFTAAEEEGTAGIIFSNQPTAIEFIRGTDVIPFIPVNGAITISSDGLVWPGDFNNDGAANNMDALHLGLAYGATGPERSNANINWLAQYADLWMAATPQTLTDYRHIDADGNGMINSIDTLALSQNWAQDTDNFTGGGNNGTQQSFTAAPIYLEEQTVQADTRVRIPIVLGTEDMMVEGAYGVAFTITYESDKVEVNSSQILYNGWLGGESGDLIGMYHDFPNLGKLEVVMVRTDGQNVNGSGQLAELSIIMEDVIIASLVDVVAEFKIENVRLISYQEVELSTSPRTTDIVVENVTAVNEPEVLSAIELSPNPTDGLVRIAHDGLILEQSSLQDAKGRVLNVFTNNERIDLGAYPAGIYILKIQTDQGVTYRKVVKH